ncbi:hypothetical protein BDZ45DRAFT_688211 [Acephala macrosclerotiorum]|nr:hypothetical protein BDZ45DRAFT_688211 [Acephala macrosclerotiorum]
MECVVHDLGFIEDRNLLYGNDPDGTGYKTRAHLAGVVGMLGPPPLDLLKSEKGGSQFFDEDVSPTFPDSRKLTKHACLGKWKADVQVPSDTSLEQSEANLKGRNKEMFMGFQEVFFNSDLEFAIAASSLLLLLLHLRLQSQSRLRLYITSIMSYCVNTYFYYGALLLFTSQRIFIFSWQTILRRIKSKDTRFEKGGETGLKYKERLLVLWYKRSRKKREKSGGSRSRERKEVSEEELSSLAYRQLL